MKPHTFIKTIVNYTLCMFLIWLHLIGNDVYSMTKYGMFVYHAQIGDMYRCNNVSRNHCHIPFAYSRLCACASTFLARSIICRYQYLRDDIRVDYTIYAISTEDQGMAETNS